MIDLPVVYLMTFVKTLQSQKCKQTSRDGLQNGNKIRNEQPLWLLVLFIWLSSFVAPWVWNLGEWGHHWGNTLAHNG